MTHSPPALHARPATAPSPPPVCGPGPGPCYQLWWNCIPLLIGGTMDRIFTWIELQEQQPGGIIYPSLLTVATVQYSIQQAGYLNGECVPTLDAKPPAWIVPYMVRK